MTCTFTCFDHNLLRSLVTDGGNGIAYEKHFSDMSKGLKKAADVNEIKLFYVFELFWSNNTCLCTGCTRKTRIIDVVYNASNNELVRTKTLVKNCIVLVDSLPYRQWYEAHYTTPLGRKKGAKLVCLESITAVYWDCEFFLVALFLVSLYKSYRVTQENKQYIKHYLVCFQ